jgi:Flp pilus assembly protein TadG
MSNQSVRRERNCSLRCIRSHDGGATAVEFAIIAPAFFLLVFVVAELALLFVAEEMLERATKDTARLVRTGQVHANNIDKQEFQKQFCRNLLMLSCSSERLYLDVNAYESFAEMDTTPPLTENGAFKGNGVAEFGQGSDIVVVRAYYQWPTSPIIGNLTLANLENGRRLISSFAAFRNEPFSVAAGGSVAAADQGTSGGGKSGGPR